MICRGEHGLLAMRIDGSRVQGHGRGGQKELLSYRELLRQLRRADNHSLADPVSSDKWTSDRHGFETHRPTSFLLQANPWISRSVEDVCLSTRTAGGH